MLPKTYLGLNSRERSDVLGTSTALEVEFIELILVTQWMSLNVWFVCLSGARFTLYVV
jgi:hypothetical protein